MANFQWRSVRIVLQAPVKPNCIEYSGYSLSPIYSSIGFVHLKNLPKFLFNSNAIGVHWPASSLSNCSARWVIASSWRLINRLSNSILWNSKFDCLLGRIKLWPEWNPQIWFFRIFSELNLNFKILSNAFKSIAAFHPTMWTMPTHYRVSECKSFWSKSFGA